MDLEQVYEAVKEDSVGISDVVTPVKNLFPQMNNTHLGLKFGSAKGEGYPFTDWGVRSYLGKIKVPIAFYNKCTPELQLRVVTELHGLWDGTATVRLKKDNIRFVGSGKYAPIDNLQVMEAVRGASERLNSMLDVREFDLQEKSFVMRAVGREPIEIPGIDRVFKTGLQIVNSETGCSALRVQYILFEEVCSNGLVSEMFSSGIVRIHKRSLSTQEFADTLADFALELPVFYDTVSNLLKRSATLPGGNAFIKIMGDQNIPEMVKTNTNNLLPKYQPDYSSEVTPLLINVVSAFTEAIQDSTVSRLERVRMETFAGRLLGV